MKSRLFFWVILIGVCLIGVCLILFYLSAPLNLENNLARQCKKGHDEELQIMALPTLLPIPLVPRLSESIKSQPDGKALAEFFSFCTSGKSSTCIMDLSQLTRSPSSQELQDQISNLRRLATTIKKRDTQCGNPKFLGKQAIGNTSEDQQFCFWKEDVVSDRAMQDFSFETRDWQWVVQAFQKPMIQQHHKCLAFLDLGVNVGDWASPITAFLPNIAYFGVEGSPPTAAIAAANMLTSIRYHKHQEHVLELAPRALVPFAVMSQPSLKERTESGGVCFNKMDNNIGGQSVQAAGVEALNCDAGSTAGAAYFPDVLHNLAAQFQPGCRGNQTQSHNHNGNVWPSIYIAKFDIQGFEFQALGPATPWLEERPPCYMMLEFTNKEPQNAAITELLINVAGYDTIWRNSAWNNEHFEQPPSEPHWRKSSGTDVWVVFEQDFAERVGWYYINYIFGFEAQEECIQRLLTY